MGHHQAILKGVFAFLSVVTLAVFMTVLGDESLQGVACRSVHLWYPAQPGTAFYNEVTVEKSAAGTYFMVCGWSKGYFGLQELAEGKKVVIFSVWDPASGEDAAQVPADKQVRMLHKDTQVRVGRFGNEGTGGQAFFDYDWKRQTTYRFLVTATANGPDRTAYTGHFYLPEQKEWKRLVTFSTLTEKGELLRDCYSFIEDFRRNMVSATKMRQASFGNGWIKSSTGEWVSLDKAQFTADANPVLNIDAGAAGQTFFLATGGTTVNATTRLQETITRESADRQRPSGLPDVK